MAYQYRLAKWAALTKERGELGMSIRAYCAMKGFGENTYFYWQRRLRDAAAVQLENGQASLPAPQFAQVALIPAAEASAGAAQIGQLHVEIKGIHLSVDSGYPPEKLAVLLRELNALC
jgi:hypothetical protein